MSQLKLKRYAKNPILTPTKNNWENLLVFNPAVVKKDNKIHLIYRAQGTDDAVSRLGHGVSHDGINFIRSQIPLYFGYPAHPNESLGIEDPRAVNIEETIYLVYSAVSENKGAPINPKWREPISKRPKISLSTTRNYIDFEDYDVILPDFEAKNASLFPKKVNDEYWLLFRKGLTTYFSRSAHLTSWLEFSPVFSHRPGEWDSIRTGIGNPPIETELGWLSFYHGVDSANVYRLGLIAFDLNNPERVIYRSSYPLLEPEEDYERFGFFPNVVFTCGTIEVGEEYFVYYGCADNVIGLATIKIEDVLEEIKTNLKIRH